MKARFKQKAAQEFTERENHGGGEDSEAKSKALMTGNAAAMKAALEGKSDGSVAAALEKKARHDAEAAQKDDENAQLVLDDKAEIFGAADGVQKEHEALVVAAKAELDAAQHGAQQAQDAHGAAEVAPLGRPMGEVTRGDRLLARTAVHCLMDSYPLPRVSSTALRRLTSSPS